MSRRLPVIMAMALVCIAMAKLRADMMTTDFYVATNGNDAWTGKLPAPNREKTDGPLSTDWQGGRLKLSAPMSRLPLELARSWGMEWKVASGYLVVTW